MRLRIRPRLPRRRRPQPLVWEIRITCPDGELVDINTEDLYFAWRYGLRSIDGYLDILGLPRLHVWVKPRGYTEPDERLAALDGTATYLPGYP